jgi:signal transduction histidine kinase
VSEILESVARGFESNTGRPVELSLAAVPRVCVDREEIVRLVQNLVLNAHEASPEGGVISLGSSLEERGIVISVADQGRGIPEDFLRTGLFQPFRTTKADGLGIGLFHAKKIVDAPSGAIEVSSAEARGTTVRVILPAQSPAGIAEVSASLPERSAVTTTMEYSSLTREF